ncbi:acyltransferase family protein [Waterburya agarophytonicola K14]|uniref:Acyltransferase family protein n=1 Tax=Waterburya agarophytonicola KI4 TaxID=2874699 RepID=A0A964BPR7_9CYAN|nr:lysophospholipid acyltransferase family protein [Waterburya agarophytonicola]MCC0176556.1 acyltransferase family protein [Waterburya agarophytonicola KI4]
MNNKKNNKVDSDRKANGWSLENRDPQVIESLMPFWEWFYKYYFCVTSDGWEHIPEAKTLLVGSHNGGLATPDMVMTMYDWFGHFGTQRRVYGLMHPSVWKINPSLGKIAEQTGAVVAHPQMAIAALKSNASVLVYPGGAQDVFRPHSQRNQINLAGRKGFIKLALREEVPIIPIISHGAHDTLFVLGDIYDLMQQFHEWGMPWLLDTDPEVFPIYLGLPWGIGFGPLPNIPLPAKIHIRILPPIVFPKNGKEASRDRNYVDECYETVMKTMQSGLDRLVNQKNMREKHL